MPTEAIAANQTPAMHPVAARRILRLAFGTSICLLVSQFSNSPLSFVAPIATMSILGLPLPAPTLKKGVMFVVALLAPMIIGMLLLPFLHYARWTGIGLVALGLFYSFYYTARGGNAVMGMFMTVGLTLIVTIGSVNIEILIFLVQGLGVWFSIGMIFVWIAHAVLPELPPDPALAERKKPPPPPEPDPAEARRNALRSTLIVLPLALMFLYMNASPSYTIVMIKVASMGQQASSDKSKEMGNNLLLSTLWGGVGAIIGWHVLTIWPSLIMYTLLIALAGLIYGRRIFEGSGMSPKFSVMSYAFLTMIVILAPAVLEGGGGSGAGAAFWSRLFLFMLIAVYGTAAVAVFDAFWPGKTGSNQRA